VLLYYQLIPFKGLINLDHIQQSLYGFCQDKMMSKPLLHVLVYSLPAALYAFSLVYYLRVRYLQRNQNFLSSRSCRLCVSAATIALVAVIPEMMQLVKVLPGEYDSIDVLTAALASVVALYL